MEFIQKKNPSVKLRIALVSEDKKEHPLRLKICETYLG